MRRKRKRGSGKRVKDRRDNIVSNGGEDGIDFFFQAEDGIRDKGM